MDELDRARLEVRARILKALAHPTRLFLVDVLSRGERPVAELSGLVGADISTVSKHLAQLKAVGILSDAKRGTQVFYRLTTPCVLEFFTCLESILGNQVQRQIDLVGRPTPRRRA